MSVKVTFPYLFILVLLAVVYVFPWRNIDWGKMTMNYPRQFVIQGYAETDKGNQVASFTATINTINDDKQKAVDEVNNRVNELNKKIKEFGVADNDIKTQSINIYQEERYDQSTQRSSKGQWRVSNSVEAKVRDVSKVNDFTNLLTTSGADNVWGPNFMVDAQTSMADELLNSAVENAKKKAESLAKSNGVVLGKVVSISEGGVTSPIVGPMMLRGEGGAGGGAGLEPGSTTVSKTVTVVFEIQ